MPTWPQNADGRNKRMAEMSREEQMDQMRGALNRVRPAIERSLSGYDHSYEPGAYGVCRRCGCEKH